jgi:hypothetical protein
MFQEHYDNFFEDVYVECEDKYGEIEEMNVCDNLGDHLAGKVYIKVSFADLSEFIRLGHPHSKYSYAAGKCLHQHQWYC